jgi:SAM-dependent methyltransferase
VSPESGAAPRPITRQENHEQVLAMAARLPRGRLLDAPCGEGALAARLAGLGFAVSCADVDPGLFRAEGLTVRATELNQGKLPFEDASFDVVVSVNGLHRLWNPANAVAEYARVLAPGGVLLTSFPNYAHLSRRLRFLATGGIARNISRLDTEHSGGDPAAGFRQALLFSQAKDALDRAGLVLEGLETARRKRTGPGWRLLAAGIRASARLSSRRNRETFCTEAGNSDAILLGSHHLYLSARKAPVDADSDAHRSA